MGTGDPVKGIKGVGMNVSGQNQQHKPMRAAVKEGSTALSLPKCTPGSCLISGTQPKGSLRPGGSFLKNRPGSIGEHIFKLMCLVCKEKVRLATEKAGLY